MAPKRCFGAVFLAKTGFSRRFFRGQISRCGRICAVRLSSSVDFKQVKNNLQGFRGNLYPRGVGGEGVPLPGVRDQPPQRRRPVPSPQRAKIARWGPQVAGDPGRDQGSVRARSSGHCSFFDSALVEGNFLQPPAVGQTALAHHGIHGFPGPRSGTWESWQPKGPALALLNVFRRKGLEVMF